MNLKSTYHVVIDSRKYGGERKLVSVNKLADYIPKKRAEMLIKNVSKCLSFPKRYSLQGMATITFYLK